jgi:hypothetical protein
MKTKLVLEMSCFINKLDDGKVPKKNIVLVKFSCALFSLVDFLTHEDGTNRLSQNVGKELPLIAA